VALGYLNRPEATNKAFLTDPHTGARRYRTGDRARFRPDGTIEFLGRVDQQLKLRGFRMEPGEVEAALRRHPQVQDAVVDIRPVGASEQLVGYVVADTVPRDLAAWARRWLPEYMVPGAFVALPRLPLNAAGKVDRRSLPAPLVDATATYEAPRTPLEREIAALWAEVLGAARVGIHDNFFELGGHSLLATQIVARLRDRYQVEIPLQHLFDAPTVAALAEQVAVQSAAATDDDDLAALLAEVEALSDEEAAALLTGLSPEGPA
jgi:acyl carrier protein